MNRVRAKVLLVSGDSKFSWLIRLGSRSKWTHCSFAFQVNDGPWLTVEADQDRTSLFGVVLQRDLGNYAWEYKAFDIVGLTPNLAETLHSWCRKQVGKRYDVGKALGLGFWLFFGISGLRPIIDNKEAFLCYELVWEGLHRVGLDLNIDQSIGLPRDLASDPRLVPDEEFSP